jgi:uncharacterized protein YqeY
MENLKEKINQEFITAFKSKEMEKKNFLGVIKGEIQNAEGRGSKSSDEDVMGILKKLEKSLKQSIENGDEESKNQLEILKKYLPEQMSSEDIKKEIDLMIKSGLDNIGMIMRNFNQKFKGMADNSEVSKIAKELISH